MQTTYGKCLAIACTAITLSGCQLMLANHEEGDASLALVPTADWGAMRASGLGMRAATEISDGLDASITGGAFAPATKVMLVADPTNPSATSKPSSDSHKGILPIKGSESILFSNQNNHRLDGCSTLGVIELHHTGNFDDALIVLRNETYRLNSNLLVPIKASRSGFKGAGSPEIRIEAQMMRCPFELAYGKLKSANEKEH